MRNKLLIIFLFIFYIGNAQQFSLDNLQTNERIEIALDSAYQWTENRKINAFINNYIEIENAIELTKNEEYTARFEAYKASFYYTIYDTDKFDFFLNKALDYYEKKPNKAMLVYLYNLKSLYTTDVYSDYPKAINWNKKALEIITNDTDEKLKKMAVDVYYNLTLCYAALEDWNATYEASNNCIELSKKYSKSRMLRMYYFKGLSQVYLNDIEGAIVSFKHNEDIVKKIEASSGKKVYFKNAMYLYGYSEAYRVLGDDEKSTHYIRQYSSRLIEGMDKFSKSIGKRIQKNSETLVNLSKVKEQKAESKLKKTKLIYSFLTIGLALLIISGLLIFIFQQKKHQKLNLEKNRLLTSKNNELRTIKEEVENALKVKTDFLNSITHELRTPLYAINSITHMIKENEESKVDDYQIDILSFSGDHLLRFINDVIDFNLGANNFEAQDLKLESVNLERLLFKIKKTITFSLVMDNENNFSFDFDHTISDNLKIDTLKLSRIIINLLNNASKYTQKGDILLSVKQLKTDTKTSIIAFSIKDTGKGISKTQLNEINIAFKNNLDLVKRIDNKASGLGMGLVMVNRLLSLHNSTLHIDSEEGVGTTVSFVITFNIDNDTNETPKSRLIEGAKNKRHILIVDDNKINQIVTSKIIKNLGHTCDIATGGDEAITMFNENNNYDFILMDIMMPGKDGFKVTEIIKSIHPKQKIIALTAMSTKENEQKFIDSGFQNVIVKPFVIEKFKAVIT